MRPSALGLCVLLASCAQPFPLNVQGYEEKESTLDMAWQKSSSVEYLECGYWHSPVEVEREGHGDCVDIATVMMYWLGPGSEMLIVDRDYDHHALVRWDGLVYEAQVYGKRWPDSPWPVIASYSYNEVMRCATLLGIKSLGSTSDERMRRCGSSRVDTPDADLSSRTGLSPVGRR